VFTSHKNFKPLIPFLRRHLGAARDGVPSALDSLSVVLLDDREMSRLHMLFLNLPGPTDVLTFPVELNSRGKTCEGEVYICVPEARRRAKIEGVPLNHELLLYAIHGLLHLAGHDDRTERGYQKMHQLEDKILTKLGVGPVFERDSRPDPGPRRRA